MFVIALGRKQVQHRTYHKELTRGITQVMHKKMVFVYQLTVHVSIKTATPTTGYISEETSQPRLLPSSISSLSVLQMYSVPIHLERRNSNSNDLRVTVRNADSGVLDTSLGGGSLGVAVEL